MVSFAPLPLGDAGVRTAKTRLLEDGSVDPRVREEIATSWRRSRMLGADPERFELPYEPGIDAESPLLRAALPVLDRLATLLTNTETAIILSDGNGRIVARRVGDRTLVRHLDRVSAVEGFVYAEDAVGTNGLGTVVETGRPIAVVGSEHFADRLVQLTCVGAPINDPVTRQLVGVIDLTCHVRHTNSLLRPLVEQAGRDITERLCQQRNADERALLHHFLRATHAGTQAAVAINARIMIANARASRLLDGVEHGLLWEEVSRAMAGDRHAEWDIVRSDGSSLHVRLRPVRDADASIGALLEIRPAESAGPPPAEREPDPHLPGVVGRSAVWRTCCRRAWQAVRRSRLLILTGEPGVGKFALATALHEALRPGAPLVVADAAATSVDGSSSWLCRLRQDTARHAGGTLIVRGLELLTPAALKGLQAIVRRLPKTTWTVIATATHPADAVLDLAGGARVEVPPLRERLADLSCLVTALVERQAKATGRRRDISGEVLQAFHRLRWPGNVGQLAELIGTLSSGPHGGPVRLTELPVDLLREATRRPLSRFERAEVDAILAVLRETGGNKKKAAECLGISRSRLYRKLQSVGIDLDRTLY